MVENGSHDLLYILYFCTRLRNLILHSNIRFHFPKWLNIAFNNSYKYFQIIINWCCYWLKTGHMTFCLSSIVVPVRGMLYCTADTLFSLFNWIFFFHISPYIRGFHVCPVITVFSTEMRLNSYICLPPEIQDLINSWAALWREQLISNCSSCSWAVVNKKYYSIWCTKAWNRQSNCY